MEQSLQKFNAKQNLLKWSERIASCRNSGMSVREWCKVNGIPPSTYYNQQRKVFEASKSVNAPPKSHLGKAVYYLSEQEQWLRRYLEDGRLEIDNNRAERSVKPFVMSRKNFLFANTPGGAESSAVVFSLIQTAIETGLDPYRYLTYVFSNAPRLFEETTDWVTPLLPENAPKECRVCES